MKAKNDQIKKWLKEFNQIKGELLEIGPFRNGTIIKRWQTCNKAGCKCREDKNFRHWPYYSWTTKEKAKTVSINVPEELIKEANAYVTNAKAVKEKIKKMSNLSDKIIQRKIDEVKKSIKKTKKELS